MNVGIIIRHCGGEEMRGHFAAAARQGFHHCQLVSWDPQWWTEENAEEIMSLTQEFDMEITAFWCGWEGPRFWNFTEGPETLGVVPVTYRALRVQNLLDGVPTARNTSGVRGVYWSNYHKRWIASGRRGNKLVILGSFEELGEASEVRKQFVERTYGDAARHLEQDK